MRRIDIDVFVDTSLPDQPRVALLLAGLTALPRLPTLRLYPVDPDTVNMADGQWPDGDLLPLEARVVDDGAEIIFGADIVDYPALLPGTAVEIELPDLSLKGEFLWPSVPVASRTRRRSVVARRPVAPVRQQTTILRNMTVEASPPPLPPAQPMRQPRTQPHRSDAPRAEPVAPRPEPVASAVSQQRHHSSNAAPMGIERSNDTGQPGGHEFRGGIMREPAGTRFEWQPDAEETAATPAPKAPPIAPVVQSRKAEPPVHANQRGRQPDRRSTARIAGMVLVGVLLIETAIFAVRGFPAGADVTAWRPTRSASSSVPDLKLLDVLQTAAVSPRGIAARETNPQKLLALANASLRGQGGARDIEEGAYWLKRYVTASLGEERMLRALTQLGSTFAEPANGQPDYNRARQLWEFAGNLGDPVAMCFLGTLHEHGLGVAAEKKYALQWYVRARVAGGCPNVEESIARVMP